MSFGILSSPILDFKSAELLEARSDTHYYKSWKVYFTRLLKFLHYTHDRDTLVWDWFYLFMYLFSVGPELVCVTAELW